MTPMKVLDIGCGKNKYKNELEIVTGMDKVPLPGVDVIHDMEQFPYTFADESFDKVIMQHSLEHVSKENMTNIKIIEEIHRILKPGGMLIVEVPIGQWFHYDPTHKNYVGYWYWKYFSSDFSLNFYTATRLELVKSDLVGIHGLKGIEHLTTIFNWLYQRTPNGIERFINFMNLDAAIRYELRKV
jgi:SAM-dependent methyltransferase